MHPLDLPAGALCVLVGPPGCGKSTLAARWPDSWRVCLDRFRELATDSEADQTATSVAVEIQNLLLDARLSRARTTIVDSTNLETRIRADLLSRARHWQRATVAVLFDVPLDVVEARNASRRRVVHRHVVRELHQLLPTSDQLQDEGFTDVHLISRLTAAAGGGQ
ncbi:ATP-binding protein [Streptomyces sp. NBC_01422]|uniref:ATP-binding protein n=1 Tax=Streptomyces sp. NBC_01422 TaxID=2903859 RepID=UPI002E2927CE|nr:ATP-binding protein [Streptomyces sp. NBC_01422]